MSNTSQEHFFIKYHNALCFHNKNIVLSGDIKQGIMANLMHYNEHNIIH